MESTVRPGELFIRKVRVSLVSNVYAYFGFIEEQYINSFLRFSIANLMCSGCKLKETCLSVALPFTRWI